MDRLRQHFRICGISMRKIMRSPRFYIVLLWMGCLNINMMLKIGEFSAAMNEAVSPWIFPLTTKTAIGQICIICGAITLFCDAPFLDANGGVCLARSGRTGWFWGNWLYIVVLSLLYAVILAVLPNIWILPRIKFMPGWGKILGALAQTNAAAQYGIRPLNYTVMAQYTPVAAVALTVLSVWLNCILVGVICFALNLLAGNGTGIVVSSILALTVKLPFYLAKRHIGFYISPPLWMHLEYHNKSGYGLYPTPAYIYSALLGLILVFSIAAYFGMKKKDLNVRESDAFS